VREATPHHQPLRQRPIPVRVPPHARPHESGPRLLHLRPRAIDRPRCTHRHRRRTHTLSLGSVRGPRPAH
jgi:hypothetical protein